MDRGEGLPGHARRPRRVVRHPGVRRAGPDRSRRRERAGPQEDRRRHGRSCAAGAQDDHPATVTTRAAEDAALSPARPSRSLSSSSRASTRRAQRLRSSRRRRPPPRCRPFSSTCEVAQMRCGPEARTRRTGSSSWRTHSMATGSPGSRPPDVLSAAGSSATCAASTERAASAKGATSTAAAANAPAAGRSLASYPAREGNRSATLAIYGIQRDTKPAPDAGSRDASPIATSTVDHVAPVATRDRSGRARPAARSPRPPQSPRSARSALAATRIRNGNAAGVGESGPSAGARPIRHPTCATRVTVARWTLVRSAGDLLRAGATATASQSALLRAADPPLRLLRQDRPHHRTLGGRRRLFRLLPAHPGPPPRMPRLRTTTNAHRDRRRRSARLQRMCWIRERLPVRSLRGTV